jgi:hypothetical protein
MHSGFQVRVKKPVEFICAALRHFRQDSFISLEGDLSCYDSTLIPTASQEPTTILQRHTIWPEQQFIILPITDATADTICRCILPQIGLKHKIVHVQIAAEGRLVLGAYDSFHDDCVWIEQTIGSESIVSLLKDGIIGWYCPR